MFHLRLYHHLALAGVLTVEVTNLSGSVSSFPPAQAGEDPSSCQAQDLKISCDLEEGISAKPSLLRLQNQSFVLMPKYLVNSYFLECILMFIADSVGYPCHRYNFFFINTSEFDQPIKYLALDSSW